MVVQQKVMPVYIHSGIKYIGIWQRRMFVSSSTLKCVLSLISVPQLWLEKLKLNIFLLTLTVISDLL